MIERAGERSLDDGTARTELEVLVDSIVEAAATVGVAEAHRPWLDPLPEVLDRPVESSSIGLIDDPARQARRPLRWERGNLLLVGAIGSGTTSTAIALAGSRLRAGGDVHLYVIDGRGDATLDVLGGVAQCGGVIRVTEAELVDRLLRRLTDELDRRSLDTRNRDPRSW